MHGYLSHVVQRIPEISQNGANSEGESVDSLCGYILNYVMLKSVVMSLCVLSTASMTALMCCLLTCMAYLMTFSIEMTCTNVSCCWVCVSISWLTLFLMSLHLWSWLFLVSQLRASPKKGKRLLFMHFLKGDIPLKEGSLFSSWVPMWVWGLRCIDAVQVC